MRLVRKQPAQPLVICVIAVLSCLGVGASFVRASQPDVPKPAVLYAREEWTEETGLPAGDIGTPVQTRDGYIWVPSSRGLLRFDGNRFVLFDALLQPGLGSNKITALLADNAGRLWIGTFGKGLSRIENGTFTHFTTANGLSSEFISELCQDSSGTIWVATDGAGICKVAGDSIVVPPWAQTFPEKHITSLAADRKGVWIGTTYGLYYLVGGNLTRITHSSVNTERIYAIHAGEDGVWVGTVNLVHFNNDNVTVYTKDDGLPPDAITAIAEDKRGGLWIGAEGLGMARLHNGVFSRLTFQPEMANSIRGILVDREGNIWAGQYTGLLRLRDETFSFYTEKNGLAGAFVASVVQDRKGRMWTASEKGLQVLESGKWRSVPLPVPTQFVYSIAVDSLGHVWVNTRSGRLLKSRPDSDQFALESWFPPTLVWVMHSGSDGTFWIGSNKGLIPLRRNARPSFSPITTLSNNDIRAIAEDKNGVLWVGTSFGLNAIMGDSVRHYMADEGLANPVVTALYAEQNGDLWIGGYGGLVRMRNGKFFRFNKALTEDLVACIMDDGLGYFWLGRTQGLVRVKKDDLHLYAEGKIAAVPVSRFDKSDGLYTTEVGTHLISPAAWRSSDGRLWFTSHLGLAVVNPRNIRVNTVAPPVVIETFMVDREPVAQGAGLRLSHSVRDLQIDYTAPSFVNPKGVRYLYKLAERDQDWVDARNKRTAFFSNLEPGTYTFRVIAANEDGLWNPTGASLSFTIVPPFWATWWFRSGALLLVLALAYSLYRWRLMRIIEEQRKQEAFTLQLIQNQENERQRIAAELHDGLGQSIIVVKNRALLGLQPDAASGVKEEQLKEISTLASRALKEIRQIAHNLRPVNLSRFGLTESIQSLVDEVAVTTPVKITSRIDEIDGLLDADGQMHFFRVVQEGLANLTKHAGATSAELRITYDDKILCVIEDDGKGFDTSDPATKQGHGRRNIEYRVGILGGTVVFESAPNNGTKLIITVPTKSGGNSHV